MMKLNKIKWWVRSRVFTPKVDSVGLVYMMLSYGLEIHKFNVCSLAGPRLMHLVEGYNTYALVNSVIQRHVIVVSRVPKTIKAGGNSVIAITYRKVG